MGKRTNIALIVLAVAGVVIAVLPFDRPGPRRSYTYNDSSGITSGSCSPPVVSAWRDEPTNGGWFSYAPLTAIPDPPRPCTEPARQRLAIGALLVLPGLLVWFLRRRRIDRPPNPQPNLAA